MFYHFFGHACSRIFHKYLYTIGSGRPVAYTDISFGGKLNRIVHQIVDNLAQASGIGSNSDLLSRKIQQQFHAFLHIHSLRTAYLIQYLMEGDVAEVELHGVRLYLGEVQDVGYQDHQQLAVLFNQRGKFDDVVLGQV